MTTYNHANINMIGPCSMRCYYCIGSDVREETQHQSCLLTKYEWWYNFKYFLDECAEHEVKQIYLTGLNTDPLLYLHFEELVDYLHASGFYVGVRTNAKHAFSRNNWNVLNRLTTCKAEAVGLSIPSFIAETLYKITNGLTTPAYNKILRELQVPYRISIVVNRYNVDELWNMLQHIASVANENLKYVQMCKISSVRRYEEFELDRRLYDEALHDARRLLVKMCEYEGSVQLGFYSFKHKRMIPVSWWTKDTSTMNALNYFTNGIVSYDYWTIESFLQKQANEP